MGKAQGAGRVKGANDGGLPYPDELGGRQIRLLQQAAAQLPSQGDGRRGVASGLVLSAQAIGVFELGLGGVIEQGKPGRISLLIQRVDKGLGGTRAGGQLGTW
ncbi:MAG TPA: hypothetical protein PLL45_13420 [Thermoflexales bacterium]|nr:hypothetical protein [Thermoflexales bacterium]